MPKAFRSTCESSMEMETARYRWSWYFVNVCTVMARWPFQNCHDSNTGELKDSGTTECKCVLFMFGSKSARWTYNWVGRTRMPQDAYQDLSR